MTNAKKRVLVLCTGNSCEVWEARSAGTALAARVHPLAVCAMADAGVDISRAVPENVRVYLDDPRDLLVTVCDSARETRPTLPRPWFQHPQRCLPTPR